MPRLILLLCLFTTLTACKQKSKADPYQLLSMEGQWMQVIVEIPAGTNHKIEYDYASGEFLNDQVDGQDRVIDFLPYPGNYGFVPGTLMDKERGGDGDALDILVIGEAVPTGTSLQVKPLGALVLKDGGEIDTKLIAIPSDKSLRVLSADNFMDFALRYDAARRIIEDWFQNYKGTGRVEVVRWEDESYAWAELEKWKK